MFGRVHFVDWDPYGPERRDLTIMDLEALRSVSSLSDVLGGEGAAPTVLFADHCLEHLSRDTIDHLLVMAGAMGAACLIRVPNVLSPEGRLHFEDDPTHRTPFDEGHRRALVALGLSVTPHARWYRRGLRGPAPRAAPMDVAEEVVIAGRPSAAPASIPTEHA
jgi:hypothetical protein